jgi:hypothetical protein
MSISEEDCDDLQLSAEAQRALKEFYEEQNEKLLLHNDDTNNIQFDEDWVSIEFILNFFNYHVSHKLGYVYTCNKL